MAVILKEVNRVIDDQAILGAWKASNLQDLGKVLENKLGFPLKVLADKDIVYVASGAKATEMASALAEYFVLEICTLIPISAAPSEAKALATIESEAARASACMETTSGVEIQMSTLVCVITLRDNHPTVTNNRVARRWLHNKLTSNSCKDALEQVTCISKGKALKVHVASLPEQVIVTEVLPVFQQLGSVKRLKDEEKHQEIQIDKKFGLSKRKKTVAVGDLQQTSSFFEAFDQLHGQGGSAKKARRFARRGMCILSQSKTVAPVGLNGAPEQSDASTIED
jgi:hypothetical protein